ncbi:MAG TPA: hypothetical protein VFE96_09460 [Candidatus Bathyarchaeia archaeon]|nr:hypothetical protein [Candidatus Bathyarchaeia archaeon]
MRFHHPFLAPWIVLSFPGTVFLGFGNVIVLAIAILGLLGMFSRKRPLATIASVSLLLLLVLGKVGLDITRGTSPDTSVLLIQVVAIIFLMEASRVILSFDSEKRELSGKTDGASHAIEQRLNLWIKGQISRQAALAVGALGVSLALLVLGGFTSVSINQLVFSAILVLLVVGALLFLVTQKREPETRRMMLC